MNKDNERNNTARISNRELINTIQKLVKNEKRLTVEILKYLAEIDKRKLYCDQGLGSLFQYCTKNLKYSEAEATIRIQSMRLMRDSGIAKKKIEDGQLSLTTASKLQSFFKKENKSVKEQAIIINEVSGQSKRVTEKILNSHVSGHVERTKKLILEERLLKKLEFIQEELEIDSELEAIEALLDARIAEIKMNKSKRRSKGSTKVRYVNREIKEALIKRSGNRCEYVSPEGKRCNCRSNLQYDHIRPISEGGKSIKTNMRLVCFAHNQRFAIRNMGVERFYRHQTSMF